MHVCCVSDVVWSVLAVWGVAKDRERSLQGGHKAERPLVTSALHLSSSSYSYCVMALPGASYVLYLGSVSLNTYTGATMYVCCLLGG